MKPLIRISPSKDGGRRMLTEEAKATLAAWLHMIAARYEKQWNGIHPTVPMPWDHNKRLEMDRICVKCDAVTELVMKIDQAFDASDFATAWDWVQEIMYGKPDDTAGDSQDGDAVR